MYHIGLAIKLKPGCYDDYKRAHDEIWPDVAQSMAAHRVSMAIYRFGEHLFVHAIAPTQADWQKSREYPVLDRWNQEMTRYLKTDDQGHILFEKLSETYVFGLFKPERSNDVM